MLKGYVANQKRLEYLEKTIKVIDIANRIDEQLKNDDVKEILKIVGEYSKALVLLDFYDYGTVKKPNGIFNDAKISYEECINVIEKIRFNVESNLFAVERIEHGLEAIINDIYQTFDSKEVYETIEEKAANFLYMIVKITCLLMVIKGLLQHYLSISLIFIIYCTGTKDRQLITTL